MKKPKKWTEVFPQGTKEGVEEQKFFIALARDAKAAYKSTSDLAKETKLPLDRIEQIISKYHALGMIFQSENNDNYWAYWQRDESRIKENKTLVQIDQDDRIEKQKRRLE